MPILQWLCGSLRRVVCPSTTVVCAIAVAWTACGCASRREVGEIRRFKGHAGFVWSVAFSSDNQHVFSAAGLVNREGEVEDCTIRRWDVATGQGSLILAGHTQIVRSIVITRDGRRAVSGSDDGTVRVWDLLDGRQLSSFREDGAGGVAAVALTPDERGIVAAEGDRAAGFVTLTLPAYHIRLWDIDSGTLVRKFGKRESAFEQVAVAADGRTVISTDLERAMLWNLETGEELRDLVGYSGGNGLACSPDGKLVVTGGRDHALHLWNVATGTRERRLEGHDFYVRALAFSADGRRIISTDAGDFSVRLWDVASGKELQRFVAGPNAPTCVALSPDGKWAVTASSLDHDIILWGLPK